MTVKGTTTQRGYGSRHRRERDRWKPIVAAGAVACSRCGFLIVPGSLWDLDHDDARGAYLGPAHRFCNRSVGGRKGNASPRRRGRRRPTVIRTWGSW